MKFFKLPDALNKRGIASKWKKFTSGFTLVELVVVIAILAILSGIGVLGYNGYIEYAQRAADEELIAAVNTAFSAACEENGVAFSEVEDASTIFDKAKRCVEGISKVDDLSGDSLSAFNDSFLTYYAGNEKTALKYYQGLEFKKGEGFKGSDSFALTNGWRGIWRDNGDGTITVTARDDEGNTYNYTLDKNDLNNVANSTFGKNMEMSSLMGEVDNVVQALKSVMGTNYESLEDLLGSDYLKEIGLDRSNYPEGTAGDEAYMQALTNAVVMHVADSTAGLTADDVLNTTDKYSELDILSQMASVYGLVTGFANSDIAKDGNIEVNGKTMTIKEYYDEQSAALRKIDPGDPTQGLIIIMQMMTTLEGTDEFEEYQSSDAYENDLNGFFSAMNALSGNRETILEQGTLDNGYADDDLGAILNALFG